VPHTDRADEIGALARAIKIFQEAMERNRNLIRRCSRIPGPARSAPGTSKLSVDAFREAIGGVLRAVATMRRRWRGTAENHCQRGIGCERTARCRLGRDEQASSNVSAVASAAEELSASSRKSAARFANPPARSNSGPAHREIDHRDRRACRRDATDRRRAQPDPGDRRANQSAGAPMRRSKRRAPADAGRGFAVVAHEVKALAEQTAKATAEIGQNVGLIQTSTQNSVDAVREIGNAVREINDVTSNIANAISQQDTANPRNFAERANWRHRAMERWWSISARSATPSARPAPLPLAVLTASSDLTATAQTLSREVENFFRNLRADPLGDIRKTGT